MVFLFPADWLLPKPVSFAKGRGLILNFHNIGIDFGGNEMKTGYMIFLAVLLVLTVGITAISFLKSKKRCERISRGRLVVPAIMVIWSIAAMFLFPTDYAQWRRPVYTSTQRNVVGAEYQYNRDGTLRHNRDGSLDLRYSYETTTTSRGGSPVQSWPEGLTTGRRIIYFAVPLILMGITFFSVIKKKSFILACLPLAVAIGVYFLLYPVVNEYIPKAIYNRAMEELGRGDYFYARISLMEVLDFSGFSSAGTSQLNTLIAESYYDEAKEGFADGDFEKARRCLRMSNPSRIGQDFSARVKAFNQEINYHEALVLLDAGDLEAAIELLSDAGETGAALLQEVYNSKVEAFIAEGNFREAYDTLVQEGNVNRIREFILQLNDGMLMKMDGVFWLPSTYYFYELSGVVIKSFTSLEGSRTIPPRNADEALIVYGRIRAATDRMELRYDFDEQAYTHVASNRSSTSITIKSIDTITVTRRDTSGEVIEGGRSGDYQRIQ